MEMEPLPSSIILQIILLADVSTLKSLRLTSRVFYDLTRAYGHSIKSTIFERNHSTELRACFEPSFVGVAPVLSLFRVDQRICTARWIAALAIKNRLWPLSDYEGFDPRPTHGDMYVSPHSMLNYITKGIGILWRLSDIAQDLAQEISVECSHSTSKPESTFGSFKTVLQSERSVLLAQVRYIAGLTDAAKTCLFYAFGFCVCPLFRYRVFEFDQDGSQTRLSTHVQSQREHWVMRFILRKGPGFIATAWRSADDKKRCTALVSNELLGGDSDRRDIECEAAQVFYVALKRLMNMRGRIFNDSPPGTPMIFAEDDQKTILESWLSDGKCGGDVFECNASPLGERIQIFLPDLSRQIY